MSNKFRKLCRFNRKSNKAKPKLRQEKCRAERRKIKRKDDRMMVYLNKDFIEISIVLINLKSGVMGS